MELIVIAIATQEKTTPNYVVPTSNFHDGQAYLLGVPCKVLSDHPYKKVRKTIFGDPKVEDVIDVQSCVTSIKYTVPTDWVNGYDSLVKVNDFDGKWGDLYKKKCEIVSVPFKEKPSDSNYERTFILVRCEGKIYRTLFHEYALIEP